MVKGDKKNNASQSKIVKKPVTKKRQDKEAEKQNMNIKPGVSKKDKFATQSNIATQENIIDHSNLGIDSNSILSHTSQATQANSMKNQKYKQTQIVVAPSQIIAKSSQEGIVTRSKSQKKEQSDLEHILSGSETNSSQAPV